MSQSYDQFFKSARKNASNQSVGQKIDMNQFRKSMKKQQRLKKSFPVKSFSLFVLFAASLFLAIENYDTIESYFHKIEIGLSSAEAQIPSAPVNEKEKSSTEETKKSEAAEAKKSTDETDFLFKLSERKKELDQREEYLNKKADEVTKQKEEIEAKLSQLEDYRNRISTLLKDRISSDSGKIETLVQVYSNMKPAQAAKVFETMDEDLVIEILGRMKKKNAADILNLVKIEKAQVLAEKYAGYRGPATTSSEPEKKDGKEGTKQ